MDGLAIRAVVHELQTCTGGRIHKIYQPGDHDLVMQIRKAKETVKLLLSANPTYPRLQLTRQTYVNPLEAPMFCMLLRKHCEGGVIESIEQVGLERIVHIRVRQLNEVGDTSYKTIIVELMGRHSNIILIHPENGTIYDGIHHVTPAVSSYRVVLPGSEYTAPPEQGKINPLTVDREQFAHLCAQAAEQSKEMDPARFLVNHFDGISPLNAREIAFRAEAAGSFEAAFFQTMEDIRSHRYTYLTASGKENGKSVFSVIDLTHLDGAKTYFSTISECLETFYESKVKEDTLKQKAGDLMRLLKNEKDKNERKLEKLLETLEEAKQGDQYRILGELLTANLHRVKKGDVSAEVVNYYDERQSTVTVPLDPQLSPAENAQRYFRKYSKSKNSLVKAEEQIRQTEEELRYLDEVLRQLETAALEDIEEIREELAEQGYLKERRNKAARKKKNDKPLLHRYISSEGTPIYVGKNNKQNEYLTNRLARPDDLWLHTKDIPGSHVIVRERHVGQKTLEEAAMLAAYFSRAKQSSSVPVDYTAVRHVRKPVGAKPGFVIYDHQKTLYVTPDEEKIKRLKMETH
jgi:predicted ribosome quality control (RQC) complex YloA/Tae2 family protein